MKTPFILLATASALPFAILVACGGGGENKPPQTADLARSAASTSESPAARSDGSGETTPAPPQAAKYTSKKSTQKTDPAWAECHSSYRPQSAGRDLEADVSRMANLCKNATHMHLLGTTLTGTGSEEKRAVAFPFHAKAGKCYRVFAESEPGVRNLDLEIKDSSNEMAGDDSTDDSSPIVLEDGAVCFKVDDDASVSVSVGTGKGRFALQIWTDE